MGIFFLVSLCVCKRMGDVKPLSSCSSVRTKIMCLNRTYWNITHLNSPLCFEVSIYNPQTSTFPISVTFCSIILAFQQCTLAFGKMQLSCCSFIYTKQCQALNSSIHFRVFFPIRQSTFAWEQYKSNPQETRKLSLNLGVVLSPMIYLMGPNVWVHLGMSGHA